LVGELLKSFGDIKPGAPAQVIVGCFGLFSGLLGPFAVSLIGRLALIHA
jgi:hypothetical protein